jgi:hypothetical protein
MKKKKKKTFKIGRFESIKENGEQGEKKILRLAGDRSVDIIGESHYQDALEEICGGRTQYDVYEGVIATLIPEDDNPIDENAVRVEVQGRTVGYLKKPESKNYREKLREAGFLGILTTCKALILGGGEPRDDYNGYYGVTLWLPSWGRLSIQEKLAKKAIRDLSERILCSDGNCIGTINENGICNICGKPHRQD